MEKFFVWSCQYIYSDTFLYSSPKEFIWHHSTHSFVCFVTYHTLLTCATLLSSVSCHVQFWCFHVSLCFISRRTAWRMILAYLGGRSRFSCHTVPCWQRAARLQWSWQSTALRSRTWHSNMGSICLWVIRYTFFFCSGSSNIERKACKMCCSWALSYSAWLML